MHELLYVSTGKLARLHVRPWFATRITADITVANIRVESGHDDAAEKLYPQVVRACRIIDRTPGFTRWLDGNELPQATWFTFDSRLRWGCIGRGVAKGSKEPLQNIVFFGGPSPSEEPVVDLMLGGWAGHLVGEQGAHDPSGRIGSRLDDFVDLWTDIAVDDRHGTFRIPRRLSRIRREKSRGDTPTLEEVFRWAYGTFDHSLRHYPEVPLRGYAQVLATLPAGDYERPLVAATPLYVEFSHT